MKVMVVGYTHKGNTLMVIPLLRKEVILKKYSYTTTVQFSMMDKISKIRC